MDKGLALIGAGVGTLGLILLARWAKVPPTPEPPPPSPGLATIYGKVTLVTTGKPLPNVMVELGDGTYKLSQTDVNGDYAISDVDPGPYMVSFSLAGVESLIKSVNLKQGNNRVDASLVPVEMPPVGYKVSATFRREKVCQSGYMDDYGNWVCLYYFPDEREGILDVTNLGDLGRLTIAVDGWYYYQGEPLGRFTNASKQWTDQYELGQSRAYSFNYLIPVTGMTLESRFFVKVYDPNGNIIFDQYFVTEM